MPAEARFVRDRSWRKRVPPEKFVTKSLYQQSFMTPTGNRPLVLGAQSLQPVGTSQSCGFTHGFSDRTECAQV